MALAAICALIIYDMLEHFTPRFLLIRRCLRACRAIDADFAGVARRLALFIQYAYFTRLIYFFDYNYDAIKRWAFAEAAAF